MPDIVYLTVAEIIGIYDLVMQESEQAPAALVREDALQRAVHHPRTIAYYEGASLAEQAVDLARELALAHAWVDGNKRISVRSMQVFLALNGVRIPSVEYTPFADAFIEVVGAKPDERPELTAKLVEVVEGWIEPRQQD